MPVGMCVRYQVEDDHTEALREVGRGDAGRGAEVVHFAPYTKTPKS